MLNKEDKIKRWIRCGFVLLSIMVIAFAPVQVRAVTGDPITDPEFQLAPNDCGVIGTDGKLVECEWGDFLNLINRIMRFIIFISASIATLAFAYAGFMYLTAFGEMGKIEEAHNIFKSTITGMIIIMLAWLVVATILKVLEVEQPFSILDLNQPVNTNGLDGVQDLPQKNTVPYIDPSQV
jgi:hypothetical protein